MQMVVEWTDESMERVANAFPKGKKLYMLNLLRFRQDGGDGQTGADIFFGKYVPAFAEVSRQAGVENRPIFAGHVAGSVVGPADERWDAIAIVEYDSFEDFRKAATSPAYAEQAASFRKAALEDGRLIASVRLEMPE